LQTVDWYSSAPEQSNDYAKGRRQYNQAIGFVGANERCTFATIGADIAAHRSSAQ
jgi:hypothetical protein